MKITQKKKKKRKEKEKERKVGEALCPKYPLSLLTMISPYNAKFVKASDKYFLFIIGKIVM